MLQGGDTSAGQLPENIGKNRYRDVLPYEVSKCWLINILLGLILLIILYIGDSSTTQLG